QAHPCPRGARLAVATVLSVMSMAGAAPGAAAGLALGTAQPGITRFATPAAHIQRQRLDVRLLQAHTQLTPRARGPQHTAGCALRADPGALGHLGVLNVESQRPITGRDADTRLAAEVQLPHLQLGNA